MSQAIPVFVINLARRTDRLERVADHLSARGVSWQRVEACDARAVTPEVLDRVITPGGPLGDLGFGDRACTVSHTYAWEAFLATDARYGLFLEDDVYLSADIAAALVSDAWIPKGTKAVKLEKFGSGVSRVLLGPAIGTVGDTGRQLHRMQSRHVGGGAYILSREGAEIALGARGRMHVPVDHLLFNDTVSPIFRRLQPVIVQPAMATQRHYEYNSDIASFGKAARPTGWKLKKRKIKRGLYEISQAHRQLFALLTRKAKVTDIFWQETMSGS
ncbi:glycosyl transferase, family 25 [Rhizobium sp. RU20A]|uniref:glycosyltransferase family 25 protein n=1 Tax=Rhizobium sp. RU20A TaxID=1907412 RepID=UPI0009565746|nr:glycosyltransferase family 25 protein [Rhizobium sp. RU20A]SIQ25453.1 glycosyl transferase, family 25 [Rhizobium sp. RU20A]